MNYKLTPAEARKAWVAALRSDEYMQGTGSLCQLTDEGDRRYCCLGVACEVMLKTEGDAALTTNRLTHNIQYAGHAGFMPGAAQKWLGVAPFVGGRVDQIGSEVDAGNAACEYIKANGETSALFLNNDSDKFTFNQIADIIESNPTGLFLPETVSA